VRLRDATSMPALAALVMPLPKRLADAPGGDMGRTANRALVLLREIAPRPATAPRVELLRGLFGLTRAEAEVARALSGGATKRAVADARGLREVTVRTQVRAILEKTGAANLRDLERMLAGLYGM
jgi:DNA-binding NarL/FixJ family response regulator